MAQWGNIGSSGNVEDRRGMGTGGIALTGVGGLIVFLLFAFMEAVQAVTAAYSSKCLVRWRISPRANLLSSQLSFRELTSTRRLWVTANQSPASSFPPIRFCTSFRTHSASKFCTCSETKVRQGEYRNLRLHQGHHLE